MYYLNGNVRELDRLFDKNKGEGDFMAKRPGRGISPKLMEVVLGRKVTKNLEKDTIFTWNMV